MITKEKRVLNTCLFDMLPKLDTFTENSVVTKRPVAVTAFREEQIINYPKEAIREILLNSVMHRDYNSNMPIRYYEFKDRIEVMNAGGLYGKARPENFPTVNDYRNPIVAGALKNLGYVNMFNRGVRRVKELFEENGNPPVQFNVDKITVFEVVAKAATQILGTKSKWDQVKVGPSRSGTKSKWDQVKVEPSQKENLLQVRPSATRCWNIVLTRVLCHQFCSIWVIRIDRSSAISILSQ